MQPRIVSDPDTRIVRLPNEQAARVQEVGDYYLTEEIGAGAIAKVYSAYRISDGRAFAVKTLRKSVEMSNPGLYELFKGEVQILRSLRHENIISFVDYFESHSFAFLVLELCDNGNLQEYLYTRPGRRLRERDAFALFRQIVAGVMYLNENHILHRDLKLENILLTREGVVKIADLGLAKKLGHAGAMTASKVGTPITMAPEVLAQFMRSAHFADAAQDTASVTHAPDETLLSHIPFFSLLFKGFFAQGDGDKDAPVPAQESLCGAPPSPATPGKGYGFKSDLYSLGVILYVMLFGAYPFLADSEEDLYECIKRQKIPFEFARTQNAHSQAPVSDDAKRLIAALLKFDAAERIEWPQLASHALLREDGSTHARANGNDGDDSDDSEDSYVDIPLQEDKADNSKDDDDDDENE